MAAISTKGVPGLDQERSFPPVFQLQSFIRRDHRKLLFDSADYFSLDQQLGTITDVYLGVWAAEEDENLQTFSDLSERRWLHYLDAGKGSGTPENVIFDGRFFCRPDS